MLTVLGRSRFTGFPRSPRAWKDEEELKNQKTRLALAIARGESVTEWALRNNVPRRSAFRWASDPKVRRSVESWRRRALDRAIGRMAGLALKAANGIARLADGAESESVQLRSWRAILADQMDVSKFSNLEQRIAEVEALAAERVQVQGHAGQSLGEMG